MPKLDLTTVNEVVEALNVEGFNQYLAEGYKLLDVSHQIEADGLPRTRSTTIFTMGKYNPNK